MPPRKPKRMSKYVKMTKDIKQLDKLRASIRAIRPDLAKDVLVKFAKLTRAKTLEKNE